MLQFNKTTKKLPYSIINHYAIGVDALSLQLVAHDRERDTNKQHLLNVKISDCEPEYQKNSFTVKKEVSNNPAFHIQFGVYNLKQRLCTLYSHPTKGYGYTKHLRPLYVENSALYTMEFARLIPDFLKAFDFQINNISQLDIFIDNQQQNPSELIQALIQDADNYQRIKHKNDTALMAFGPIDEKGGSFDYTTYIGKESKRVQAKIYNKVAEKDKPYITPWQKANGLTNEADKWRFELSAMTEAFTKYKPYAVTEDGELTTVYRLDNNAPTKATNAVKITEKTKLDIDITQLSNKAYLISLFEHFINIDIRRKDATRISRCSKVPLFDYSIYGKEELIKTVTQNINMSEKIKEKKFIKHALETYKSTGNVRYLEIANDTAERNELYEEMAKLIEALRIKDSVQTLGIDYLLDNYALLRQHHLAAA
ncbi:hypothetical protein [Hymenobacter siberiensis]|uniref:hypothetical protein n=1 Tax=Hymenobacter siberiensis TaxID=2848396 RepID=UPI001C1DEABE|nr:hypothetical protein [Hymenobacter siberiensis]